MSETIQMIAARLKALREIQNFTTEEIANCVNVSNDIYQKYESGEIDIPASVLYELAQRLGVEMAELLTGEKPRLHTYSVVRKDKRVSVDRQNDYKYASLAYNFTQKKAEPFYVTVEPRPDHYQPKLNYHPGQEFNFILEGRLKVFIGKNEIILEEGDSIYFDPTNKHTFLALDNKPAKMLVVLI